MDDLIVIIAAAGLSRRMKSPVNKAFLELDGESVIRRTVKLFLKIQEVKQLYIMVAEKELAAMEAHLADLTEASGKLVLVKGGSSRQESVGLGLSYIADHYFLGANQGKEDRTVCLVHDGARCLVRLDSIRRCIRLISEGGQGSALAVPVTDTIHQVGPEGEVVASPDRTSLVACQTPQGALFSQLRTAYLKAELDGFQGTDDISLLSHAGIAVQICPGERDNIKITHPEDLAVAEKLLEKLG